MAIKYSPKTAVIWVANKILKGIAELSDFFIDLDARTAYVQLTLYGETDPIEVQMDQFAIINEEDGSKKFIIQQAKSNKPWLNNMFAYIIGKAWKIAVIPQLAPYMDLIAEVLKAENISPEQGSTAVADDNDINITEA